eukprot:825867-Pelagomonas_calceolata.AAC.15
MAYMYGIGQPMQEACGSRDHYVLEARLQGEGKKNCLSLGKQPEELCFKERTRKTRREDL